MMPDENSCNLTKMLVRNNHFSDISLTGLGWLMVLISGVVSWYYNMILGWVLYYLYNSFYSTLPWSTCNNAWNTEFCRPSNPEEITARNESLHFNQTRGLISNDTGYAALMNNDSDTLVRNVSSSKEFWQ